MPDTLVINMNFREVMCCICGNWTEYRWGVPTFNGDLVSNHFPDWLWRQGGGSQPACEHCFRRHAAGELPAFDRFYLHLSGTFADGDGI